MNLMEKLAVNKWLVERDEAVVKVAELEAWKVQWADALETAHSEIAAEAIRDMMDSLLVEFASRDSGDLIYEIYQYAKNLEKSDG